jgi:AbrB family looped-hinge helix DNA binding protein
MTMSHVFEIKVKSQGRIVIPSYVRLAANIKPGDWVVVQLDKIIKKGQT